MLTKKELSDWLKISIPTIDRWMAKGLPYTKVGKIVRFEKEDVEKWMKDQK